jgi:hypothetical protein
MVEFGFTEEQELFRKAVREWCEKNLPIEKIREMDTQGWIPQSMLKSTAELARAGSLRALQEKSLATQT